MKTYIPLAKSATMKGPKWVPSGPFVLLLLHVTYAWRFEALGRWADVILVIVIQNRFGILPITWIALGDVGRWIIGDSVCRIGTCCLRR